jgi:putative NADH-flavin reductase
MGAPVVLALLESGFDVMAITRPQSTATFPARVTVKKVDTTSTAALTETLKGQDAVVSTVGTAAASTRKTLIDAAVAAHFKRFIPSEFGYNTREARGTKVGGLLKAKIETVDYLIELSKRHDWFTWTGLSTGTLFDWVS